MQTIEIANANVGVLVGRFQVDELHEAHLNLIKSVVDAHDKVIIFLGMSPVKCTTHNPLDFESRKQMILEAFPLVNVLYIKDQASDVVWSKNLDAAISDLCGPHQKVLLYGGRDSFIKRYTGKYNTQLLHLDVFISGGEIRNKISNTVKGSSDFRRGVIWATANQYPQAMPTVDICVYDSEHKNILLGRKPNESKYRFIGGFVSPNEELETAAMRELKEESGLTCVNWKYIKSFVVDDWRYRSEKSKIVTCFFTCTMVEGTPQPDDDIIELKFFNINTLIAMREELMVKEHIKMLEFLRDNEDKTRKWVDNGL